MGGLFISYRREDCQGWVGRLAEAVKANFDETVLFLDIESIKPGDDFIEAIEIAVGSCALLLALIGPRWLSVVDKAGNRRLDDPKDFVRLEISIAISRKIRIIPILLGGATMPRPEDLPPELIFMARLQALELTDTRWEYDFEQLAKAIEKIIGTQRVARQSAPNAPNINAISVGKGLSLEESEANNVVGIEAEGAVIPGELDRPVDVLCDAKLKRSKVGDIVGIKLGQGRKEDKP
ncbi:TIR domain-containing protein [Methylobacter tundripaludum]|uniref:TIR domain-containing protein n=1 Tax=Methylobacter tundripaludum TaxID=173365 RepID=A0A2S6H948_9GAMM|nr:toll/interleukin-1 receptor domain-containing protein [Methylobacter tundripaludum]PPK73936.1 TIR domain-containing protein [Methylobacter tundripaludum]